MNDTNIPTGSHIELDEMYSESIHCSECGEEVITSEEIEDQIHDDCHEKLINLFNTNQLND